MSCLLSDLQGWFANRPCWRPGPRSTSFLSVAREGDNKPLFKGLLESGSTKDSTIAPRPTSLAFVVLNAIPLLPGQASREI